MNCQEPKLTQNLSIKYIVIRTENIGSVFSPEIFIESNSSMARLYNKNHLEENPKILETEASGLRLCMEYLSEKLQDNSTIDNKFYIDEFNNSYSENTHGIKIIENVIIIPQCKCLKLLYACDQQNKIYSNDNDLDYIELIRQKLLPFVTDDSECLVFKCSDIFNINFNVILARFILIFENLKFAKMNFEFIESKYCVELNTLYFTFKR
jgi:hypothetical protein